MTENMITVALIVGDPGHEGLQLNEGSLAAAAKMIEVHGAATHGRWDAGRRSTVWCFDMRSSASAEGSLSLHLAAPVPALSQPVPVPVAVIHPVLAHLPVRYPRRRSLIWAEGRVAPL